MVHGRGKKETKWPIKNLEIGFLVIDEGIWMINLHLFLNKDFFYCSAKAKIMHYDRLVSLPKVSSPNFTSLEILKRFAGVMGPVDGLGWDVGLTANDVSRG